MHKNIIKLNFIFLLLLILHFFPISVNAQSGEALPGLNSVCLDWKWCDGEDNCSISSTHRVQLSSGADKLSARAKTYVTECLELDSDNNGIPEWICTTGSSALDQELLGVDNLTRLQQLDQYSLTRSDDYGVWHQENGQFVRKEPPTAIMTDSFGNIVPAQIEWQSYTKGFTQRRYVATNVVAPAEGGDGGGVGGQQQADLGYRIQQKSATCGGRGWDPYGRVFDAVSLEPIPDARVALKMLNPTSKQFEEAYASSMNPLITNPQPPVGEKLPGGRFTFIVQDGDYSLAPTMGGYAHPTSTTLTLPQNTTRVYSNIYYSNSDPIRQRGVIQQRDIPLQPADGIGKKYPLSVLSLNRFKLNTTEVFEGQVSHPFAQAKVRICNQADACREYRTLTSTSGGPNKEGRFRMVLDLTALQTGERYNVEFMPIDLNVGTLSYVEKTVAVIQNLLGKLVGQVHAQDASRSISIDMEPIPSYLEGYAYDAQGKVMSNAIVKIYIPFSKKPFFQVRTNENGYYKVVSSNLPTTEYSIAYQAPQGSEVKYSTSQVLEQNKEFIEAESINNYITVTALTDPRRTVTPSYTPKQQISVKPTIEMSPTMAAQVSPAPQEGTGGTAQNPVFLIGAILLLLVAAAGTLLAVYLYRKRTQEPTQMNP